MFKLVKAEFQREVEIKVPVNGGFKIETIDVTFVALDFGDGEELLTADDMQLKEYVRRTIVKIDGIVDENDKPVEWNDEVAKQVLNIPYVFSSIHETYQRTMSEARVKN